jgi:fibronectin-binding autotransporter adhesin
MNTKLRILTGSIALLFTTPAFAVTDTWDGGGANDNLNTALNWADNTAPVSDLVNTDLIFGGGVRLTPNVSVAFATNSIVFNNTAGAFTIGGLTLTLGTGGITNNDADTMTFNNMVAIGAAASTFNTASGALTFNGTVALNANTLTLAGTNALTFGGALTGSGLILKSGTGAFNLDSAATAIGADFNLNAGTTTLNAGVTQTFLSGSTIALGGGNLTLNESAILDGAQLTRSSGTLAIAAGKTLTVQSGGDVTITGIFSSTTAATVAISGAGSTFTTTGTLTLNGGVTVNIASGGSMSSGVSNLNVGTAAGGGTVTVDGTGSSLSSSSTLSIGASGGTGEVTFSNGATGSFAGISVDNSGIAGTDGTLSILSGASVTGTSLVIAPNSFANSGTLTINGAGSVLTISGLGTTTIGAASASTGRLNVESGGMFTSGTGLTTVGATGVVSITGGTFNVLGTMNVNGLITRNNTGSFNLAAGNTLTFQNGGDFNITGTFSQSTASTIAVTGAGSTLTTTGTLTINGGSELDISAGGGASSGVGGITIGNGGDGRVTVDGAASSLSGGPLSIGTNGNVAIAIFSNAATGSFAGINVDSSGFAGTDGALSILSGSSVTGTSLTIAPIAAANSGAVTINGAGSALTISGAGNTTIGAASASTGTLNVQSGGTFTSGTGNLAVNTTGTVAITGGTFNANGNVTLTGLMTRDASGFFNLAAGRTLSVQNGGDLNFAGGYAAPAAAIYNVTGAGSTFVSGGMTLSDGNTLNIASGGSVSMTGGQLNAGFTFGTTSTISVDGVGSSLGASSGLNLGSNGGTGIMTLSNGATGSVNGIGVGASSFPLSSGTLNIESGASFSLTNALLVASSTGGGTSGTVTVTGAGSTFTHSSGPATIGSPFTAAGIININDGGVFNSTPSTTNVRSNGTISIAGGTYNSNGSMTVDGLVTRNGAGTLNFALGTTLTVQNGGDVTITGALQQLNRANLTVNGAGSTLTTSGDFIWDGTGNTLSLVNVNTGGLLSSAGALHLARTNQAVSMTVSGAGSQIVASPFFTSEWQAGVLLVNGASATLGGLRIADVNFSENSFGSLNVQTGSTVSLGTLAIASAVATSTGSLTIEGTGSAVTQTSATGPSSLTLGAAFLSSATLTVNDGGTFTSGTGAVTLNATGTINIGGGTVNLNGAITDNGGTVNFTSGALNIVSNFTIGTGGLVGDGDLAMTANKSFSTTATTTIDAFRTLTLDGGIFRTGALVNNGTLDFKRGTLGITGAGGFNIGTGALGSSVTLGTGANLQVTGTTTVATGALLRVDGGSFSGGAITNDGTIDHANGTLGFTGPLVNTAGSRLFVGGLSMTTGAIDNAGRITMQNGIGFLGGAGTLTNTGIITGDGTIARPVTNNATGTIRGEAGRTLTFTGGFAPNAGTLSLLGGTLEFTNAITNSATGFVSGAGNLITGGLTNNGTVALTGDSGVFGDVTNASGARIVTSGGATTTFYDDVTHNGAEIRTSAGSASVFLGAVSGSGPFTGTGTVYLEGDLRPGNSPATVSFGGDVVFSETTALTMELGGLTRGSLYDGLNIAGSLYADGILSLSLINGYAPGLGDSFDLFDAASTTGSFDSLLLPALAQYLTWDTSGLYSTGTVEVSTTLTPIEQWRQLHFGIITDSGDAADLNDFDFDGSPNLLEYALAMDPRTPNVAGAPAIGVVNVAGVDYLTLTITRPLSATDITYQVEAGGTLTGFLPGSSYSAGGDVPSNASTTQVARSDDGTTETIVVRANTAISAAPAGFLRLKVSNP